VTEHDQPLGEGGDPCLGIEMGLEPGERRLSLAYIQLYNSTIQ